MSEYKWIQKHGYKVIGQQPQVMNILSTPAPKRLWPRLIWDSLRGKR